MFRHFDFYDLSAWGSCWSVVYIRRFIYTFLNVCPFDYTAAAGNGKVGSVNQVNHTSWVAVITPTDRPQSVRNRCVIDFFFVFSLCPFDIPVGVGAFVIGLSQISSFLSPRNALRRGYCNAAVVPSVSQSVSPSVCPSRPTLWTW